MRHYTIFDSKLIIKIISGNEETLRHNVHENESWVEGSFPDDLFYVDKGVIVAFPEKPNYPHVFNKITKSWDWDMKVSWSILRQERQERLTNSDWTQVPDAPVDRLAWAEYRQELRNLPENTEDPRNIDWPIQPQ